ncbi:MAG: GGDEF domain-containing protein [bacterium]
MAVVVTILGAALASIGLFTVIRALSRTGAVPLSARGEFVWSLVTLGVVLVASLSLAGVAWWLVLRLQESRRQLRELAIRDPLTGVFNRRYFREVYASEIKRARRTGEPLSIAMLDLDGFKNLNDTRGHLAGDAVLVSFAEVLRNSMRSVDILARYGGDEFVILMPSTSEDHARRAIQRLRANLAAWSPPHTPTALNVSIGLATLDDAGEALEQADRLMYESKKLQGSGAL